MPRAVEIEREEEGLYYPPTTPDGFKKAVGVVQVAMGNLGFLHRKLANVLLCNAYEGLGDGKLHFAIQASSLAELAGFDSRDYQLIYDHCRDLLETTVEFIEFDQKMSGKGNPRRRRGATSLISDFSVTEGGLITYSYSVEMGKRLYEPEQYIWMALATQKKFSSKYELSLFENCLRYVRTGSTGFKNVGAWRALLGATEPVYDEFKYFNKKVIKDASKGVRDKAGLIVEPEYEREKRKVVKIKFKVRENPQASLFEHVVHSRMRSMPVYKAARDLGLKEVEIFYWLGKHGEQYVADAVAYLEGRNPDDAAAYLITALKKGYGEKTPEERKKAERAKQRAIERKAARAAKAKAEAEHKALADRYRQHRHARTQALIAKLTPSELAEVVAAVSENIPLRSVARAWEKIGRDPARAGELNRASFAVIGVRLAEEVLGRWGEACDLDMEAFQNKLQEN